MNWLFKVWGWLRNFWFVSILALIWNVLGLLAFVGQLGLINSPEQLAKLPEDQQELYRQLPNWVMVCFGVAVVCGVLGCIFLLMKKNWAFPVFVLSLLGVIGQQIYNFFLSDTVAVMGPGAAIFPLIVLVIAIALVYYSVSKSKAGMLT